MNDEQFKKLMGLVENAYNDNSHPPFIIKDGIFYRLVDGQYIASEPENWIEKDWMRMWSKMQDEQKKLQT
jgi:predicted RecB family nuclease